MLVTGGAGFIGSNFVHRISKSEEYSVTVVDALTYAGSKSNLEPLIHKEKIRFIHGDISNEVLMKSLVDENDLIINFAAETHVDNSITTPDKFVQSNVIGTTILLNNVRDFKKRLIQISTDEVYGSLATGYADEKFPMNTNSPYSASKASADLFCLAYFKTYGIDVSITRCSNNYGIRQNAEKLIPTTILSLLASKQVPVYGSGKNVRNWIHVEDHIDGILEVLHKGKSGEIYNFGSYESYTNLELLEIIAKRLEIGYQYRNFIEDRKGHDFRYALDFSKSLSELNWSPKRSLQDELDSIINWYEKA